MTVRTTPDTGSPPAAARTILIASQDLLATWSASVRRPTDLLAFTDADADRALTAIRRTRPQVVVLDQHFASTARGIALVHDLQADPDLGAVDIRTLPTERSATLRTQGPSSGTALAGLSRPLARRPFRHAKRVRIRAGAHILLDGSAATLVDLSPDGAQALSSRILKPGQRVRVVIGEDAATCRIVGDITWSSLELGPEGGQYRVGIAFRTPCPEALSVAATLAVDAP